MEKFSRWLLDILNRDIISKFKNLDLWKKILIILFIITSIVLILNFNTPQVIIILNTSGQNLLYSVSIIVVTILIIWLLINWGNNNYKLRVKKIEEQKDENDFQKKFKCIIENTSVEDITIKGVLVKYRYLTVSIFFVTPVYSFSPYAAHRAA